MSNIGGGGTSGNSPDKNPVRSTGTPVYTPQVIIALITAFILLMILVQYYPRVIIGLVLLILLSVVLSKYQMVSNILQNA